MSLQPTPPQLFDDFEAGRITRAQLHAGMAFHARTLVEEIIETSENPVAAWWDTMLARRAAKRLTARHGEWRIRHLLHALSEVEDFEPSHLLWNALHPDVPLFCFFRMRREPVFRLTKIERGPGVLRLRVEHGAAGTRAEQQDFLMLHRGGGFVAERLHCHREG